MGGSIFETFRVAVRALARTPAVAGLATAACALGIGGTVTVFSAVNAAFLRALPYPDAGRLVAIWQASPRSSEIRVPYPIVHDWTEKLPEVDALAGYQGPGSLNVTVDRAGGAARVTTVSQVTEPFFRTLGVSPIVGRTFLADEVRPGAPTVAIISHDLWQQLFAGDAQVLSRALSIEGATVPIVGVMPDGILYPEGTHVWVSLDRAADAQGSRSAHNLRVVARRKAGIDDGALEAGLRRLNAQLEEAYPEQRENLTTRVVPLRQQLLGQTAPVLWLLFGSVALVLAIACANVANLLIARAAGREVESALRHALGANRRAVVLPIIAEALVIAGAGAVLGVAVAVWGQQVLAAVVPPTVVNPDDLRIDVTVLAFAVVVSMATGLASCLWPAVTATRVDLRDVLASGSRALAGSSQTAMRIFIAAQVAIACVLLASAMLFARSLAHLEQVDPGFETRGMVYGAFSIGATEGSAYEDKLRRAAFFHTLIERVNGLPGVAMSGVASDLPFASSPNAGFDEDGMPDDRQASLNFRLVGGRYFDTLGIPLREGRVIGDGDVMGRPFVAVINERAARTYWRGRSPIGQRIRMPGMDGNASWYTIVGIVGDIRHRGLTLDPVPEAYFPFEQRPERTWTMKLVARVAGAPAPYAEAIRGIVETLDARIPASVEPFERLVDTQVAPTRFRAALVATFAVTALILSMVGIIGVMSHFVARRTREVGLRMALGAPRGTVQRLVVRRALTPVAIGLAVGIVATLAVARLGATLLPGIDPRDPLSLFAAVAALAACAALAAWGPAWRASRLDPLVALRDE